jgi:hypothetical protein
MDVPLEYIVAVAPLRTTAMCVHALSGHVAAEVFDVKFNPGAGRSIPNPLDLKIRISSPAASLPIAIKAVVAPVGAAVGYAQNSMVKFPDPKLVAVFPVLVEIMNPVPVVNKEPIEL